jgi:hypothetical protein
MCLFNNLSFNPTFKGFRYWVLNHGQFKLFIICTFRLLNCSLSDLFQLSYPLRGFNGLIAIVL